MPSKFTQIQFRLPWLRKKEGDRADEVAKVIVEHSRSWVEQGKCPVCKKPFDECDYFKRLDDE